MRTSKHAVAASVAALLVAVGCGGQDGGDGSGGGGKRITLVQGVKGDPFYISMACGAHDAAAKLGVKLDVTGPDRWDAALQTPVISGVTAKHPDAVLVAPVDSQAMISPLKQMQQNDIKVVQVDTKVDDPSVGVSQIATDNEQGGVLAAQTLARLIGDKGKVFVISVKPGITTTGDREAGFKEEIAKHPDIQMIGVDYDDDQAAVATQKVSAILSAHPDLAGVFATNVFAAEGAATAIKNAGKQNQVKLVGFDAGPKQVEDLRNGALQALIAQQPYEIGRIGVEQAMNALTGKPVQKEIKTKLTAVTKDNLNDPNVAKYLYKNVC